MMQIIKSGKLGNINFIRKFLCSSDLLSLMSGHMKRVKITSAV